MTALILALSANNIIGKNKNLPWVLKDDLEYFKRVTSNKPIIMGRGTWESLPKALPNRINVVITSNAPDDAQNDAVFLSTLEAALAIYGEDVFIVGGAKLAEYALAYNLIDKLILTHVDTTITGDNLTKVNINMSHWSARFAEDYDRNDRNDHAFTDVEYRKVS